MKERLKMQFLDETSNSSQPFGALMGQKKICSYLFCVRVSCRSPSPFLESDPHDFEDELLARRSPNSLGLRRERRPQDRAKQNCPVTGRSKPSPFSNKAGSRQVLRFSRTLTSKTCSNLATDARGVFTSVGEVKFSARARTQREISLSLSLLACT